MVRRGPHHAEAPLWQLVWHTRTSRRRPGYAPRACPAPWRRRMTPGPLTRPVAVLLAALAFAASGCVTTLPVPSLVPVATPVREPTDQPQPTARTYTVRRNDTLR